MHPKYKPNARDENISTCFVSSKAQIVFWACEGIGVTSPTNFNFLLVLSLTRLFIVIYVCFEFHIFNDGDLWQFYTWKII